MLKFAPFEIAALQLLVNPMLGARVVDLSVRETSYIELQMRENGYDLSVHNRLLPENTIAIGSPEVLGRLGELRVRFTVKIEQSKLNLLCRSFAGELPSDFRDCPVLISVGFARHSKD